MKNARFTTSSQSVFQDVGRDEIEVGVTAEVNVKTMMDEGYPVVAIYPEDGTGLRFDASAIIAGPQSRQCLAVPGLRQLQGSP